MDVFCIQRGEKRSTTRTTQKLIRAKTRPRGRSLCMRKSATLSADTAENEQRFAEILTKCWQKFNTDSRATSRELAPCGGDQLSAATRKVPKMSARRTCCCTPTAYLHLDSNVFVMLLSSKFVGLNLDTCKKMFRQNEYSVHAYMQPLLDCFYRSGCVLFDKNISVSIWSFLVC